MDIDWSKAPEGATHFAPGHGVFAPLWAKKEGEFWWFRISDSKDHDWYFGVQPIDSGSFIRRPIEWNGEGLPPVGTVCERNYGGEWKKTTVCGHSPDGKSWAAFYDDDKAGWLSSAGFRPIRTPEQIAAEERRNAVTDMVNACGNASDLAYRILGDLYDAGYRKFEIVEG